MNDNKEKEIIKDAFLSHIGEVMKRGRKKKNLTLENLAKEMNIDTATLSRYENGKVDISASAMAYASYVCDFPMKEYVEERRTARDLSSVFKEILAYGEKREPETLQNRRSRDPFAIYMDREDLDGNVIPTRRIRPSHDAEIVTYEEVYPVTPYDDEMFNMYMSTPDAESKLSLMLFTQELIENAEIGKNRDLKVIARAASRYITTDNAPGVKEMLKSYYERCRKEIEE